MSGDPLVLGVESSCDELAAAVARGAKGLRILSSVVHGQDRVHAPYGGVVPELASRDHVLHVSQVVDDALREAGIPATALDGVAVTAGPGLLGSLLVGLSFAKALAYRLGIPCVGIHHLAGHLASAELHDPELRPPYLGLVVSGGHTALYRVEASGAGGGANVVLLGETCDDAVGEAFDKVAKLLSLPYPGGPALSALARRGNPRAIDLPRPRPSSGPLDFSYSGLKTAVALEVERRGSLNEAGRADLAASFEAAATDVLISRARRAVADEGLGRLAVVGGVAANERLRRELGKVARSDGFHLVFPPSELCTDNAAMIAAAGVRLLAAGVRHDLDLDAFSRVPLGADPWSSGA